LTTQRLHLTKQRLPDAETLQCQPVRLLRSLPRPSSYVNYRQDLNMDLKKLVRGWDEHDVGWPAAKFWLVSLSNISQFEKKEKRNKNVQKPLVRCVLACSPVTLFFGVCCTLSVICSSLYRSALPVSSHNVSA
jgi:hypothetical protein